MTLFERALIYAAEKHCGAVRKLDGAPYILHPMEVALIASRITTDEEVLAAAVLHDTVEDTDATLDELRELFGERTAALVAAETENKRPGVPKSESWLARKEESLEELSRSDDMNVKLLWLADKLSNMRRLRASMDRTGAGVWRMFNQPDPEKHAWYYRTIVGLLSEYKDTEEWKELNGLVESVFGEAASHEI